MTDFKTTKRGLIAKFQKTGNSKGQLKISYTLSDVTIIDRCRYQIGLLIEHMSEQRQIEEDATLHA